MTIFFSDIIDFTELTDGMESETLTNLLNDYLNEMSQIALRYGGTIDKFIGDAIMIFFGDPETKGEKEDALRCVMMALEMRNHLKHLQKKWKDQGIQRPIRVWKGMSHRERLEEKERVSKPLQIRIGINTGFCTVGNFGSEDRLDYTLIGGQVNLASRLESNAEHDQILISHETYALVKDTVACSKKGILKVKGIAYPVQTYQVLDLQENLKKESDEIKHEGQGYSISINLNEIQEPDKKLVLESLQQAIAQLESKNKGPEK
jgi:class 3 adenylate cyclase